MDYDVTKTKVKASTSVKLKDVQLSHIVHCGWLKKQGGIVKSWQSRWFVLADNELFYFASDDTVKAPIGRIRLVDNELIEPYTINNDSDKFLFEIQPGQDKNKVDSNHDSYLLAASTDDDRRDWIRCIRKVIYYDRGGAIFGQPLELTMINEHRVSDLKVPRIVHCCVDFLISHGLDVEGIFRLPGRSTLIRKLRSDYDRGLATPTLTLGQVDLHSVASLLKQYLRELPEPLIPFLGYERVVKICNRDWHVDGRQTALDRLSKIMLQLPPDRYELIRYLTRFLQELATHSDNNKMNPSNLATIFAHSFLRPEPDDDPALLMEEWNEIFSLALPPFEREPFVNDKLLRNSRRISVKGMTPSRSDSDVSCQDNERVAINTFKRPLSDRELMTRFQDGTGKSLLSITRSKTALVDCVKPHIRINPHLEHSSSDTSENSGSINGSLHDIEINSDNEDNELRDLINIDPEVLDIHELRDHVRRLTSELIEQKQTIDELNGHLTRQGKRHLRIQEKLNRKLTDEQMATKSAVRRIVSLQGKLQEQT